jgi:hypothetical protein
VPLTLLPAPTQNMARLGCSSAVPAQPPATATDDLAGPAAWSAPDPGPRQLGRATVQLLADSALRSGQRLSSAWGTGLPGSPLVLASAAGITDLASGLYRVRSRDHARLEPLATTPPPGDPADERQATARFFILADLRDWAGDEAAARYTTMLVCVGALGHAICRAAASAGLSAYLAPFPGYYVTMAAREVSQGARHLLTVTVREEADHA